MGITRFPSNKRGSKGQWVPSNGMVQGNSRWRPVGIRKQVGRTRERSCEACGTQKQGRMRVGYFTVDQEGWRAPRKQREDIS